MRGKLRKVDTEDVYSRAAPAAVVCGHEEPQSSERAYIYTALRHVDEIRLLRIAPRSESRHNGELKAAIHHVYLSASPWYTAVSWMWGPQQDLVDLEIDGRVLPIRSNLRRIIQDLQDDRQARNLWIDAVCIDQESLKERNHQVQLMGRIYNNANYVVACLMAERSKDRKRLAKTARQVHQVFERCLKERSTPSISTASRLSSEYRLFFENRYFTRRWIIQEIIQARSVTLCCEGYQMPMRILESMFDDSRRLIDARSPSSSVKDFMNSRAMQLCRLRQEMARDSLPLEELLYTHETAECSDFRDQVYALLSLSEGAKEQLPVRYDINRAELMLSVINVSRMFENLSPLHALSFSCFLKQHLRIKTSEVRHAMRNPPVSTMNTTIPLQGVVRGTVRTHQMNPETEAAALPVREEVPALNALGMINLDINLESHHFPYHGPNTNENIIAPLVIVDRQKSRFSEGNAPVAVPGIDQCLFAFEGDDSRRSSKAYRERATIAGLASTRIDIGDEIWQFERTPLAIVARRSRRGYTLVGRAYLLKELSTGRHSDKRESQFSRRDLLENDLVWVKDASLHDQLTPVIDVDVCGLLKLMTWATYDT